MEVTSVRTLGGGLHSFMYGRTEGSRVGFYGSKASNPLAARLTCHQVACNAWQISSKLLKPFRRPVASDRGLGAYPLVGGFCFVVAMATPEDLSTAGGHHAAAPPVMLAAMLLQSSAALCSLCSLH